jgi:hypothetical protein
MTQAGANGQTQAHDVLQGAAAVFAGKLKLVIQKLAQRQGFCERLRSREN